MTDAQLTALSTLAWLIGTTTLFILLARWSAGGSWGISSAIARGLTGWSGRESGPVRRSPSSSELRPMEAPQVERLWGTDRGRESEIAGSPYRDLPLAEIEDLGSRRLTDQQISKSTPRVD